VEIVCPPPGFTKTPPQSPPFSRAFLIAGNCCCAGIVAIGAMGLCGTFSPATLDSHVPHAIGLGLAALYAVVAMVAYLRSPRHAS
jgi:hypothetical protein